MKKYLKKFSTNFKDSFLYSIGNYAFRFSQMLTNLIVSRMLGPELTGVISYVNAIDLNIGLLYSPFRAGLEREYPKLVKENPNKALEFKQSIYQILYLLVLLGSFTYILLFLFSNDPLIKIALLYFVGINILKSLSDLFRITLKCYYKFKHVATSLILISVLLPVLVIPLSINFDLSGFYSGRLGANFLILLLLIFFLYRFFPGLNFKVPLNVYASAFKLGAPIVLMALVRTLILTVDKFFIKFFNSLEELGFYSIGGMIFQMLIILPTSILGTYFPKFMTKKGNQYQKIKVLSDLICIIQTIIIIPSLILIGPAIKIVLPEFEEGIPTAIVFIITFYFAGLYQMFYYDIIRNNGLKVLIIRSISIIILSLPFYYFSVKSDNPLVFVALTTLMSYLLMSINNIQLAMKMLKFKGNNIFISYLNLLKYLTPIIPILLVKVFISGNIVYDVIAGLLGYALIYVFLKKSNKINEFKSIIFNRND